MKVSVNFGKLLVALLSFGFVFLGTPIETGCALIALALCAQDNRN